MWQADPTVRFTPEADLLLQGHFVAKWKRRLQHPATPEAGRPSSIWGQFAHAAHQRAVYERVYDVARNSAVVRESVFFAYIIDTYAVTQAIAVRRQADSGRRVTTLGRLLTEIAAALAREGTPMSGDPALRMRAATALQRLEADQSALHVVVEPALAYVDKRIAHMDEKWLRPDQATLAVKSIHAALDTMFDVFKQWETWLTGASTPGLVPITEPDWEAVFRVAWTEG